MSSVAAIVGVGMCLGELRKDIVTRNEKRREAREREGTMMV